MEHSDRYFLNFEKQIEAAQEGLVKLYESQTELSSEEKAKLISEYAVALEELNVTAEELMVKNRELLETRHVLEKERQQYRNLFQLAPDGYITTDVKGIIQNANQAAEILLGVWRDRLSEKPLTLYLSESSRPDYFWLLDNLTKSEPTKKLQLKLQPRNDKPFYADVSLGILRDSRGKVEKVLWTIRDISDRLSAEQKIRQQAELLDVTTDAIVVVNLDNRVTFWNRSAEKLYGWTKPEVLERNADELWGEKIVPELEAAKKYLLEREEWRGELRKLTKTGEELLIETHWAIVGDRTGEPREIMMVDTDITEKKRLELQAHHAQRLESLGTLAGGIAHDLNNILNPILGSTQLLLASLADSEQSNLNLLQSIEKNALRGAAIVKQILAYTRSKEREPVPLDISQVLAEIEQMTGELFSKDIEIEIESPENLWAIEADPTQIHQVLLNLCINARDAMPDGGTLTVRAENRFVDESYARQNLNADVGNYLTLTVADTGIGIEPDTIRRIFEPFFTTKDIGKGTGLGLFTAIEIVKSHGGFINVISEVGVGTQFEIFLPATEAQILSEAIQTAGTEEEAKSHSADEDKSLPSSNGQLILVVDDEEDNLEMAQIMLDMAGYRTMCANCGEQAIALFEEHHGEIELVLMDMMMPNMDGSTTIDHLVNIAPEVKVIALSGLASEYSLADHPHIIDFLTKPIVMQDLLSGIAKVVKKTAAEGVNEKRCGRKKGRSNKF
ncbi:PAS domain-containing hybrid sensor histidine kinase/response regulator [Myxosarcina sp. GI1(2024)]